MRLNLRKRGKDLLVFARWYPAHRVREIVASSSSVVESPSSFGRDRRNVGRAISGPRRRLQCYRRLHYEIIYDQ